MFAQYRLIDCRRQRRPGPSIPLLHRRARRRAARLVRPAGCRQLKRPPEKHRSAIERRNPMNRCLSLHVSAIVALAASFTPLALPAAGQASKSEGAQVGSWKTYVLSSGSEIAVPAPPAADSTQTQADLAELRELQAIRSPITDKVVHFWNTVPATQPWTEMTISLIAQEQVNARRANRDKAIARAAADGSDAKFTGTIPTGPGIWNGTNPVEPLAGSWKPWLMASGSQLRLGPPLAFGSPEYEAQLAKVKRINASVSPTERADAVFWGTMAGGIWLREADSLIARDGLSTPTAARILALVAAAEMDAVVAFSDTKYTYWTMRPFMADTSIQPIGSDNSPGYPSGVATDGTAAAEVLVYFFPQDADRLRYMAAQGSMSRLDAGLHFPYDLDAGAQLGRSLAALAAQRDAMNTN